MEMRLTAMLACLLTAGCAGHMVKTYPSTAVPQKDLEFVAEYGLPNTYIAVTISAPAAAGGSDTKKETPAPIYTNTINVGETASKPNAKAAGSAKPADGTKQDDNPANAAAACSALRKSYNSARGLAGVSQQRHAAIRARIVSWIEFPQKKPKEREAAIKELIAFETQRNADLQIMREANFLLGKISADCPQPLSIKMEEVTQVDRQAMYRLYSSRPLMSDNHLTVELEGGYIKSVIATADDRTADVVIEGAKLIGTISGLSFSVPKEASLGTLQSMSQAAKIRKGIEALNPKVPFNKVDLTALSNDIGLGAQEIDKLLRPIDAELPIRRLYALSDLIRADSASPSPESMFPAPVDIELKLDCSPVEPLDPAPVTQETQSAGNAGDGDENETPGWEGILVSASRPCLLTAIRNGEMVGSEAFVAADASHFAVLPVPRQAFVTETSNYTLAGGRLTKSESVRPSPVASFASVPGRAIGGFFEGALTGFKGEKDVIDAETARIEAEIKRIEAAEKLKKLRDEENVDGDQDTDEDAGG
ncbi:MAG: hypothetical protein C0421_07900 [Hyphomonas sp.]|uniref:hypothetical protein n=1 Tax=Hyphomonas sp. TaxID=87 RepID=UPI0025B8ADF0|nr:hypothetical protein [Hyphomonas sp.]MBA4338753.1 hypothetical protein [Hyphomonas sp.]